nr:hypothetical protein CFP56_20366 [Quercus suber]
MHLTEPHVYHEAQGHQPFLYLQVPSQLFFLFFHIEHTAMLSSESLTSSSTPTEDTHNGFSRLTWRTRPALPKLTASTILCIGRQFYEYPPQTILKLDAQEGEAVMTRLAHDLLGPDAPRLCALVAITETPAWNGIQITRQPGSPLVDLWPAFTLEQRTVVRAGLKALLVRMRLPREHLNYYGRPGEQPYLIASTLDRDESFAFCRTRSEWDMSRVRALYAAAPKAEITEDRVHTLERIQYETGAGDAPLVDRPIFTHGDLSDRNILVDPTTLEITGLIDWEQANIAPAYFEYAAASLTGGHQPEWRKELLEVLRAVLRVECEREVSQRDRSLHAKEDESEELYKKTLAAYNAFVNVERSAQGYSDACYWTFENDPEVTPFVGERPQTPVPDEGSVVYTKFEDMVRVIAERSDGVH